MIYNSSISHLRSVLSNKHHSREIKIFCSQNDRHQCFEVVDLQLLLIICSEVSKHCVFLPVCSQPREYRQAQSRRNYYDTSLTTINHSLNSMLVKALSDRWEKEEVAKNLFSLAENVSASSLVQIT